MTAETSQKSLADIIDARIARWTHAPSTGTR